MEKQPDSNTLLSDWDSDENLAQIRGINQERLQMQDGLHFISLQMQQGCMVFLVVNAVISQQVILTIKVQQSSRQMSVRREAATQKMIWREE